MKEPGTMICDPAQGRTRGLPAVAPLMFVPPLTRPEVVMMEGPMPIRIRHRYKNCFSPQQSDISLLLPIRYPFRRNRIEISCRRFA
jgi:hypothetical protein